MTKSELILKITSKNTYLYNKDVYKIIDTLFNCVTKSLKDGDRVVATYAAREQHPNYIKEGLSNYYSNTKIEDLSMWQV